MYGNLGEVDKAIIELQKAVDLDSHLYDALALLSYALHSKDRKTEAGSLFERATAENDVAIKVDPGNASAHRTRGIHLYFMGDFEKAIAAHNVAIDIDKTYLANLVSRGYARFALADYEGAADDFSRALQLPQNQMYTMIWLYLSRQHSRNLLGGKYYERNPRSPIPFMELLANASTLREVNRQENLKVLNRQTKLKELTEQEKLKILHHQDWPLPIIELFLGNRSLADALAEAKDSNSVCEANFYTGEWLVLQDKREEGIKALQQAAASCRFDFVELSGAKAELKRLGQPLQPK